MKLCFTFTLLSFLFAGMQSSIAMEDPPYRRNTFSDSSKGKGEEYGDFVVVYSMPEVTETKKTSVSRDSGDAVPPIFNIFETHMQEVRGGKRDEALAFFERCLQGEDCPALLRIRILAEAAQIYYHQKRYPNCIEYCQRALGKIATAQLPINSTKWRCDLYSAVTNDWFQGEIRKLLEGAKRDRRPPYKPLGSVYRVLQMQDELKGYREGLNYLCRGDFENAQIYYQLQLDKCFKESLKQAYIHYCLGVVLYRRAQQTINPRPEGYMKDFYNSEGRHYRDVQQWVMDFYRQAGEHFDKADENYELCTLPEKNCLNGEWRQPVYTLRIRLNEVEENESEEPVTDNTHWLWAYCYRVYESYFLGDNDDT